MELFHYTQHMTEPEPLRQVDRTWVRCGKRRLSYFSGCDYFRLASQPKVLAALQAGVGRFGLNVAASRLTTGNHVLYGELEKRLAVFFEADAAVIVSSGYLSSLVVAQALAGKFSHALIDRESHPSLADAARFLELTDGMFARDGSTAPLPEYLAVLPKDAELLVDDAHGAGTLGATGKGTLEHAQVGRRRIIQTVTLSKAFGVYGGAILGTAALRRRIFKHSQLFAGSTPLPLPLANAALAALDILKTDKSLRQRLADKSDYVKIALRAAGLPLPEAPGPIISIRPERARRRAGLRRRLLDAGIYPPFIKYPGGAASGYFRFVISSEHSRGQLEQLIQILSQWIA